MSIIDMFANDAYTDGIETIEVRNERSEYACQNEHPAVKKLSTSRS